jgi:hypothetical protein
MKKRLLLTAAGALLVAGLSMGVPAAQEGTWSGTVSDTMCGAKANHSAACAGMCVKEHGAKYALVDDTSHKVYVLNPQDEAAKYAAQHVTVKGSIDNGTITATSITK